MEIHREAATPIYYWDIHPVEDYVAIKNGRDSLYPDLEDSQGYVKFSEQISMQNHAYSRTLFNN